MTDTLVPLHGPGTLVPRVNWGRWVVDCPVCSSALLVERDAVELGGWLYDVEGGRLRYGAGCWDCGTRAPVVWPDAAFLDGVERLLELRPDPASRNWAWPETLHDLLAENVVHGVFSQLPLDGPTRTLLTIDGDRIAVDALPAAPRPFRQIGA